MKNNIIKCRVDEDVVVTAVDEVVGMVEDMVEDMAVIMLHTGDTG